MARPIAILHVVAWSGFWAFGTLALTANPADQGQMGNAAVPAFAGAVIGSLAWFRLARPSNRVPPEHLRDSSGGEA